jgi:thiol-disulfide isomerase/thioredoxin
MAKEPLSPGQLWRKHKSNIIFVAFILVMFIFPKNPLRIFLTDLVGKARTAVESFELDKDEQKQLSGRDLQWQLSTLNGKMTTFGQLQDKPVLLNIWATWCPPCVAELPSLEKLYKDYGDKVHFVFLAEDHPGKVKAFLEKRNLDIPVYFSASQRPFLLKSGSIPTTFILDKNAVIRVKKTGAMDWNSSKIRKLLDKYSAE